MPRLTWPEEQLIAKAREVRRDILTLIANAGSGHTGGSLSCADFATALLFNELNLDPANPQWDQRDLWHFSIGHVTPVIYSVMAERGYFPPADLLGFRQFHGHLQGHPSTHDTPGLEVAAGSLGQGLGMVIGAALGSKMDKHPRRCWCVMGDGEQQEGSVWEAVMSAAHFKLDNITAIVDLNGVQIDGRTKDVMNIEPLADKYTAFGWRVIEIDGHDMAAILKAFKEANTYIGKPTVILAKTKMSHGVAEIEDDYRWHGRPVKVAEAERYLAGMGTTYAEWRGRLENATEARLYEPNE